MSGAGLLQAAAAGDWDRVLALLDTPDCDVNAKEDGEGAKGALHYAAEAGRADVVRKLLDRGCVIVTKVRGFSQI